MLNLNKIYNMHGQEPDYAEKPIFNNRFLNQSIILKHRLRQNELELFDDHRSVVTKIILPIDRLDLRSGGQYMFLGQRGEESVLSHFLSDATSMCVIQTNVGTDFRGSWAAISGERGQAFHAIVGAPDTE